MSEKKQLNENELEKIEGGINQRVNRCYVCDDCNTVFNTNSSIIKCPNCGSTNIKEER